MIAFLEFNDISVAECSSSQLTKSCSSGGLYKIPIRPGLSLGRKISIKILSVLMQKLGFPLCEMEF